MRKFALVAAESAFLMTGGVTAAMADECSGHDHDAGTAVGAVGGGLIGGLATPQRGGRPCRRGGRRCRRQCHCPRQ